MTNFELLRGAVCTALLLSAPSAGCGDAVKLGNDGQRVEIAYERLTLAAEATAHIPEPVRVAPSVVYRPVSGVIPGPGGAIALLPDGRLALVRATSGQETGGRFQVELFDETGETLATAEHTYSARPLGLNRNPTILAGYGNGLWVILALDESYNVAHFDDALNLVGTSSAASVSAAPMIAEFLDGAGALELAYPVYGLHAAAPGSPCRRLFDGLNASPRTHGRAWADDSLWLSGCSNPPEDLPSALSKPALYQCTESGELVRAVALDLLSTMNLCFRAASLQGGRVVGLLEAESPRVAWLNLSAGTFDSLHLQKDTPSVDQAARSLADGSLVLDPSRLVARKLALGPDGEALISASETSGSANILCLALPPPAGSARCVRLDGIFDDVFSPMVLTDSRRAFVWHQSGELWGVDFEAVLP